MLASSQLSHKDPQIDPQTMPAGSPWFGCSLRFAAQVGVIPPLRLALACQNRSCARRLTSICRRRHHDIWTSRGFASCFLLPHKVVPGKFKGAHLHARNSTCERACCRRQVCQRAAVSSSSSSSSSTSNADTLHRRRDARRKAQQWSSRSLSSRRRRGCLGSSPNNMHR